MTGKILRRAFVSFIGIIVLMYTVTKNYLFKLQLFLVKKFPLN